MSEALGPIDYAKIREGFRRVVREELKGGDGNTQALVLQQVRDRLPSTLSAGGNLKVSIEETITIPVSNPNLDIALSAHRNAITSAILPVKDVSQRRANVSIPAGGTDYVDITATDRTAMLVIIRATYAAGATAGIRLRWLYSPDGTNFDSIEDADAEGNYVEPTFAAGATRQRSVIVPFLAPTVRLHITNKDTANPVTVSLWTVLVK